MSTPYAYFNKQIMPLADAKIGIMTHAFNYGTGVFEGIRGNWNEDDETIYLFKVHEHLKRLRMSAKICRIAIEQSDDEIFENRQEGRRDVRHPRGPVHPPAGLQELRGARRARARPRGRPADLRRALRALPRHRGGHPLPDVVLAPRRGRLDPGALEEHRHLHQLRARQDRGHPQRLRRGDHARQRRPRLRGQRREHRRRPRRQADHAGALRQRARGHHARHGAGPGAGRSSASRCQRAPSTAPSCTWRTRSS